MKEVFVLTSTLSDNVTLGMAEALRELGLEPTIVSYDPWIDTIQLLKIFGKSVSYRWLPFSGRGLPRKLREIMNAIKYSASLRESIVVNATANEIFTPSDISYIHFLQFAYSLKRLRYIAKSWGIDPSAMGGAYASFKAKLLKGILKYSKVILANSSFTQHIVENVVGIRPIILYPPVSIPKRGAMPKRRDDIVLTISRFSKEKRLESVFEIARRVPSAKFIICGLLGDKRYYLRLLKMRKEYKLRNVVLCPNIARDRLNELMERSKVYLHTMPFEHFGISIVEGMAHGLVPLVHRSGGPWMDILQGINGLYGYAYSDENEASSYLYELLKNEELYQKMSKKAISRALMFSEGAFKQRFKNIVNQLMKQ